MPASLLGRKWTWRSRVNATLVLLIAAAVVAIGGFYVANTAQSLHDERTLADRAVSASETIATNAHSRISQLQSQISHLERQIRASGRQRSRQIGRLEAQVRVLTRQVRELGGTPVVTEHVVTGQHHSTKRVVVKPTPRPRPHPMPTVTITPSPQPTCVATVCLPRTRNPLPVPAPKPHGKGPPKH